MRLNDETGKVERVGGVKCTIKDGIVYDAKQLLADVARWSTSSERPARGRRRRRRSRPRTQTPRELTGCRAGEARRGSERNSIVRTHPIRSIG